MTDTTQATPATLSGRIATWVTALRYEDLPEEVVERTKLLILDQLGLQLRGATLPNVQPVLRLADSEPGQAEATLAHSGELRTEHDIKPADVARIRVGLVDFAVGHGASITRPVDAISAQFSLAFSIGLQFITGHNATSDYFDADRRTDPEILAIGDLVEPYPMPIPEGDPIFSAKVDIELKDGTTYSAYQAGFHGHPSHPATETDVEQKFRDNVEGLISTDRADALVALVNGLQTQDSVTPVTALLGVDARRDG
jgi:2-methylcitrate dehydratase PrpD